MNTIWQWGWDWYGSIKRTVHPVFGWLKMEAGPVGLVYRRRFDVSALGKSLVDMVWGFEIDDIVTNN